MSQEKVYVYSSLAADQEYVTYVSGGADMPVAARSVFIKGGAGVANDRIVTPQGVATEVTAEEAAALMDNPVFKLHQSNGFVKIEGRKMDADVGASDLNANDEGRQLTAADFAADAEEGGPTPTTNEDKPRRKARD
jgi:hypothetical protein